MTPEEWLAEYECAKIDHPPDKRDDDLERRVTALEGELARIPRYPTNIKGGYCGRCRYHYQECECFAPPQD